MPRPHAFQHAKNCKNQLPDWFRLDVASLKAEAAAAVLALAFLLANLLQYMEAFLRPGGETDTREQSGPKTVGIRQVVLVSKADPLAFFSSRNDNEIQ